MHAHFGNSLGVFDHIFETNFVHCPGFSTRYLNEKWIGRYEDTQEYVEYHNNQWRPLSEEDREFIQQLWYEQEAAETQACHLKDLDWNATKQEWQREDESIEDFIATYQANYGIQYDYSEFYLALKSEKSKSNSTEKKVEKKAGGAAEVQGWVDMQEKVHAVYVSNLPTDITYEEFKEFMSKCGVIQPDARTNKPKLKLYVDEEGQLKGDGRCCYIKKESVDLALSILDGYNLRGKEVRVEKARFELKGEFDPSKKRKKLTNAQKKRYMEIQNKIFEWKPDKPRNYRPISDCTVVIKNLFTLAMMEVILMSNKSMLTDTGVVTVTFETTDGSDMAVKMLNGRIVDGRRNCSETEEERQRRLSAWQNFLKGNSDDDEDNEESSDAKECNAEVTSQAPNVDTSDDTVPRKRPKDEGDHD
uniref:RRM domain-containing protein n=1 Tax=Angiostrongylus cantonensis TaxID=6313 RepID=A0A0K0CZ94_ANGCA